MWFNSACKGLNLHYKQVTSPCEYFFFSEQSLRLVLIMDMACVLCEVQIEFLFTILMNASLQRNTNIDKSNDALQICNTVFQKKIRFLSNANNDRRCMRLQCLHCGSSFLYEPSWRRKTLQTPEHSNWLVFVWPCASLMWNDLLDQLDATIMIYW